MPRPIQSALRPAAAFVLACLAACSGDAPTLVAIELEPASAEFAAGLVQAFTAVGERSDGAFVDVSDDVRWTVSGPGAEVVAPGRMRGLQPGSVNLIATDLRTGASATAALTVGPAVPLSIALTPPSAGIAVGTDVQLSATALLSDMTTLDVTSTAAWESDGPGVASVALGLVEGVGVGTSTIRATEPATGLVGTASIAVSAAVLTAVDVTPPAASIPLGALQAFAATGTFSDATTQDLTGSVQWSSTSASVAPVSAGGVATALGVGATSVGATHPSSGIAGSAALTVTAAELVSLAVTPAHPEVPLGIAAAFVATGTFTDGTTHDLTSTVLWVSSVPTVAEVSNTGGTQGSATTLAVGTTTVTATEPVTGIAGATTLTVTSAELTSIVVTPEALSLPVGLAQSFVATGAYTDGSTVDLSTSVTWTSSETSVATISNAGGSEGLATTAALGTTTITATEPRANVVGATELHVTPAVLVTLEVEPTLPTTPLGVEVQFMAEGTYSDGAPIDLTADVTWNSGDPAVASISNALGSAGLATPASAGISTIRAVHAPSSLTRATDLVVTAAALVSIEVAPAAASVPLGFEAQFSAVGTYTDGSTAGLTTQVTWTSSAVGVATISNAGGSEGLSSSVAVGAADVVARDAATGIEGVATLSVTPAELFEVEVGPAVSSVLAGVTRAFSATGRYTDGATADLTASVVWESSAPLTATIDAFGVATGVDVGSAVITATEPGTSLAAAATLTVLTEAVVALVSTFTDPAATDLDLDVPAGVQEGDLLVAALAVRPVPASITVPSGWTLLQRVDAAGGAASSMALYWRVATAEEPASYRWSIPTSTGAAASLLVVRGADRSNPFEAVDGRANASSVTHAAPSVSPAAAPALLLTFHSYASAGTWTPPPACPRSQASRASRPTRRSGSRSGSSASGSPRRGRRGSARRPPRATPTRASPSRCWSRPSPDDGERWS